MVLLEKLLECSHATRAGWAELGNRSAMACNAKGFSRLLDAIKQVAKRAGGVGGRDLNHTSEIIR